MAGQTLYDKIWNQHVVSEDAATGEALLFIDLHLIHEVTTPQAFAGLKSAGRPVRRPDLTLAVADHNTPTEGQAAGLDGVRDEAARNQLAALTRNAPRTLIAIFFILRARSVCVANTCSTSDVPMPCARAPNAPCVDV